MGQWYYPQLLNFKPTGANCGEETYTKTGSNVFDRIDTNAIA